MQKILNFLKILQMLGIFGFILIMALIIIGVSTYNIFLIDESILAVRTNIFKEILLENIEYELLEEELAELTYVLHGDEESINNFEASKITLDQYISELALIDNNLAEVELIRDDQEKMETNFAEIVLLVDEDALTIAHLDEILLAEEATLEELENLIFEGDIALRENVREVKNRNQSAIVLGLAGLMLFPLLAVWAFFIASNVTQPKLKVSNAILSIGGGRYREDMLDGLVGRRDNMGKFATTIHEMADSVDQRTTALKAELAELEEELHKERRRKLVLTTADKNTDSERGA